MDSPKATDPRDDCSIASISLLTDDTLSTAAKPSEETTVKGVNECFNDHLDTE